MEQSQSSTWLAWSGMVWSGDQDKRRDFKFDGHHIDVIGKWVNGEYSLSLLVDDPEILQSPMHCNKTSPWKKQNDIRYTMAVSITLRFQITDPQMIHLNNALCITCMTCLASRKLEDAKESCINDGSCGLCGFEKLWTHGVWTRIFS